MITTPSSLLAEFKHLHAQFIAESSKPNPDFNNLKILHEQCLSIMSKRPSQPPIKEQEQNHTYL